MVMHSKDEQLFTEECFKNPPSEYRGVPFWSWNGRLDKEELLRQIDVLKEMGFGGFHIHVRTGLAIEYLGKEYMELVKTCVEKAQSLGMRVWLYDEDRWPSGTAGGRVTRKLENRSKHLLLTRTPYGMKKKPKQLAESKATSLRTENGRLLACFDVGLGDDGKLEWYRKIEEDGACEGIKLYAYSESAEPNPWFNNQTYVDTLNPNAVKDFIQNTHERYREVLGDKFGNLIPAVFTDEPQISHKTALDFAEEEKDVCLPWTSDLPDTFAQKYENENLIDYLPELLWELPEGVSKIRYQYHDHIAERFAEAFSDQCGDWCTDHGLMLTGHMMEEPTLEKQTSALGEAMRSYRSFHLPGIDMLCNWHEYTTAKQAQSVSRQKGAPGVMSEIYGVTNWDYDFRGYKLQGDWQAALGVTVRVPHLSWVSMNGEAKRDYPGTFNYQAPWYKEYHIIEDHFARINTILTRGKAVVHVGVVHPVESYWLHWGEREHTWAARQQLENRFLDLTQWLIEGHQDFDFIAESLLPEQCKTEEIAAGKFPVGEMRYDVILVPGCETLRSTTLERLYTFQKSGGRIVFLGDAPKYKDAVLDETGRRIWEKCEKGEFSREGVIKKLEQHREVEILNSYGAPAGNLIYQLREEGENRWLFIGHSKDPEDKDMVEGEEVRVLIKGEWYCIRYDTMSGKIEQLEAVKKDGWTILKYPFYEHDSLMLRLEKNPVEYPYADMPEKVFSTPIQTTCVPKKAVDCINYDKIQRWLKAVPITLEEENVLLLDLAEYSLDGGEYRPQEEVLRLDNILRSELNWPLRMEAVAQPWVENDESTPHTVKLRFSIQSEQEIKDVKLGLERADLARIWLNDTAVSVDINGWYVDKCIQTVSLPTIKKGKNILEVEWRYGRKVDLEAVYLLGNFGVDVSGSCCILKAPVRELTFGDITRQGLPFYGGNIIYHLEAEMENSEMMLAVTCYRGHLLEIFVDGQDAGNIIFSPYRLCLPSKKKGKRKIDIRYVGNRVNTFGQLHCNRRKEGLWWGPNSWRTTEEEWCYEYRFREQGILKSPELSVVKGLNSKKK